MAAPNPTPIHLGMIGTFLGQRYRVAGRMVMSMEEAGEIYYWNEFHLVADNGTEATLVFEETEHGPTWKLFRLIEPPNSITASEAASKQVGETFEFAGRPLRIACVDESRVCEIEGQAPEGVEEGDIARYFNAESGNEMLVVSWTGDEVEFFRGLNIPASGIKQAFGLSAIPLGSLQALSGDGNQATGSQGGWLKVLMALLLGLALFLFLPGTRCNHPSTPAPPKLGQPRLTVGKSGELKGAHYRITGRAAVEIGQVGRRHLRHEYTLLDDAQSPALLVQGTAKSGDDWLLLIPFTPELPITPSEAGAAKLGQPVSLQQPPLTLTEMFQSRVHSTEGDAPFSTGNLLYGLVARGTDTTVVARWNDTTILFYRVTPLPAKDVVTAFGK